MRSSNLFLFKIAVCLETVQTATVSSPFNYFQAASFNTTPVPMEFGLIVTAVVLPAKSVTVKLKMSVVATVDVVFLEKVNNKSLVV